MDFPVPAHLQRLVEQVDGWLDLRCPERALELVDPLISAPDARSTGLSLRVRAHTLLGHYAAALTDLQELRREGCENDWIDLTEAWCRRRNDDLLGAIRCTEQLIAREHQHDIGHFNLACYLALAGEKERAIDELSLACGINPDCRTFAMADDDFDSIRTDERFQQLLRPGPSPT